MNSNNGYALLVSQSEKRKKEYDTQRRASAAKEIDEISATYARANEQATQQYQRAVSDTRSAYREVFDSTNTSEAVAKRKLLEDAFNSGLRRSGVYVADQSAITASRQRADQQTARRKQEAVDELKREIDRVYEQHRTAREKETAAVRQRVEEDIAAFYADEDAYLENARAVYEASLKREETPQVEPQPKTPSGNTLYTAVIQHLNYGRSMEDAYELAMGRDYARMDPYEAGKQKRDQVSYIPSKYTSESIEGLNRPIAGAELAKYRVAVNAQTLWKNGAFGDPTSDNAADLLNDYLLQEAWRGNLGTPEDVGDVLAVVAGERPLYELFEND